LGNISSVRTNFAEIFCILISCGPRGMSERSVTIIVTGNEESRGRGCGESNLERHSFPSGVHSGSVLRGMAWRAPRRCCTADIILSARSRRGGEGGEGLLFLSLGPLFLFPADARARLAVAAGRSRLRPPGARGKTIPRFEGLRRKTTPRLRRAREKRRF